jgi:ABC-2 type transport system permease protein
MMIRIAQKEWMEMRRDGRFRWASTLVLALLAVSLAMGWKHFREIHAQHEAARRLTREHWLNQPPKNPHSAAHYGIYAFKPQMPLSLVDRGVDAYTGVAAWLEAHKQNEFQHRPAQDATAVARFGELTAATTLQILVPLLIIFLSFGAFAAEQEQGTLRQLLSLGVAPRDFASGKALGIAIALGTLLVPAALLGAVALTMASTTDGVASSLDRIGLMTVAYVLYFGVFTGISLMVSALAKSPRQALVVLLAFWIVNALIAPRMVSDIAKRLHPARSAFEFAQQIQADLNQGLDAHAAYSQRAEELKARLLKQYGVQSIEELPVNFRGISLQEGEEHGNAVFDKHYNALWDTFEKQNRLQQLAAVAFPLLSVRLLSMGLAGTDFSQHRHFASAAEGYRRGLVKTMNDNLAYNSKISQTDYAGGRELWEKVPNFDYTAPGLGWVLSRYARSVGLLMLWSVASVAGVFLATAKMSAE